MPSYTVKEIRSSRPWPSQEDLKVVYYDFTIEGQDGLVNIGRKPTNPLTPGTVLEGTLDSDGRGGWKFVKAQNGFGGGGGGGRGRDPKESAQIVQQHSQAQALRYCELQQARGKLPDDFTIEHVLLLAAKFAADAKAATP